MTASNCRRCGGRQAIEVVTEDDLGEQTIPCPDCTPYAELWRRREEVQRYLRDPLSRNASCEEIAAAVDVLDLLKYQLKGDRARIVRWMNMPRAELGGRTSTQAMGDGDAEAVRVLVNEVLRRAMNHESTD